MPYPTKIATCCYCGARAALRLEKGRHELSCTRCGAPLHALKALPVVRPAKPAISHQRPRRFETPEKAKPRPPKRVKRRSPGWFAERFKDLAEEVFDAVEDIFD